MLAVIHQDKEGTNLHNRALAVIQGDKEDTNLHNRALVVIHLDQGDILDNNSRDTIQDSIPEHFHSHINSLHKAVAQRWDSIQGSTVHQAKDPLLIVRRGNSLACYRCLSIAYFFADAKSQEAAQAYFDPNQPQTAYVPPPPAYYVSIGTVVGKLGGL